MGVSKNNGTPKSLAGLFQGKPYEQMDDLGGNFPPIFGSTPQPSSLLFCIPTN